MTKRIEVIQGALIVIFITYVLVGMGFAVFTGSDRVDMRDSIDYPRDFVR